MFNFTSRAKGYSSVHHPPQHFFISGLNITRYDPTLFTDNREKYLVLIAKSTSSSHDPSYYPDIVFYALIGINFIRHTLVITKIYYRRPHTPEKDSVRRKAGSYMFCNGFKSVSYTHLRAHETRHDLVC